MKHTTISLFNNALQKTGSVLTVEQTVNMIKTDALRTVTTQYRMLDAGIEKDEYKKTSFPAVTWSGVFKQRKGDQILTHSALICLDIDKLMPGRHNKLKRLLSEDEHTFFLFTSPSGNGLKWVIKIEADATKHLDYFKALEIYAKQEYDIEIDKSGKDTTRLCFLCWDAQCYVNWDSVLFNIQPYMVRIATPAPKKLTTKESKELKQETGNTINDVYEFTQNLYSYAEGSRNDFVYHFGLNCARKGIDKQDCLSFAYGFTTDLKSSEVETTINSSYKTVDSANEFGKFSKRESRTKDTVNASSVRTPISKNNKGDQKEASGSAGSGSVHGSDTDEEIQFWKVHKNPKTGAETLGITYNGLTNFLEQKGFSLLPLADETRRLIYKQDNIITPADKRNCFKFVVNYCKQNDMQDVLEVIRRGADRYFKESLVDGIHEKMVPVKRDTKSEAFFFHTNCIVKVTADKIETLKYTDVEMMIWKNNIIKRPFEYRDMKYPVRADGSPDFEKFSCEMAHYNAVTASNPLLDDEGSVKFERYISHCTSIGYMLHGYKHPAASKAVVAVDHQVPEDRNDANGGTGKSITGHSLSYIKRTAEVDGKQFDEKNRFNLDQVDIDTQILVMADCKQSLDFSYFFNMITGNFSIRKLYGGTIIIPFDDSAKLWFDTNYFFKGDSGSFARRQHIIEFSDHFTKNHTPYDYFGHSLFYDWDEEQWLLYFNHYYHCVQLYLKMGLVDYTDSNYQERKLKIECPTEVVDIFDAKEVWADGRESEKEFEIKRNTEYSKQELFDKWTKVAMDAKLNPGNMRNFGVWVKKYCNQRSLILRIRKSGGKEYYTLCDENYIEPGKKVTE